ncbi:hypothetical protein GE061_017147 [Apolygus lucorum]|uniref:SCP domain-containing protein n=1 Tax=Apolygus lucorum TaxID=248454 RepID=A0A8S9XJC0_APOLU|nr:hypothetical protein GE061_017147 [Apolygus lucorum]
MKGIKKNTSRVITAAVVYVCFVEVSIEWDWCLDGGCKVREEIYPNTMCYYKELPENDMYRNIKDAMTETDRKRLLSWFNTYRNKMAAGEIPGWPPAADMRQLTWEKDLEEVARRFSFQTRRGSDFCRRTEKYFDVGQITAISDSGGSNESYPDVKFAFVGWVEQYKNVILNADPKILIKQYIYGSVEAPWGELTSIVWAKAFKIGCATTTFDPKDPPLKDAEHSGRQVTCNIHHRPNELYKPIYTMGDACTKCPTNTSCNRNSTHPSLCALPGDPSDEVPEFIFLNSEMLAVNRYCAVILLLITRLF